MTTGRAGDKGSRRSTSVPTTAGGGLPSNRFGLIPMRGRSGDESHRASTPLELFFDLCFVVAVSLASVSLHHGLLEGHGWRYAGSYLAVFFAIWWAWMNFTWFASAYDTDDWLYRVATLVQIAGVLILAAGVPDVANDYDFTTLTIGYLVMRIGLIAQWLRAAYSDPTARSMALRYAALLAVVQIGWVSRLALPSNGALPVFLVLVVAELAVPPLAERGDTHTPWHPGHIAERYGLFTLIVLGESVLAATTAVVTGIGQSEHPGSMIVLAMAGLAIAFGMWWIYFEQPAYQILTSMKASLIWGYSHYFVFASAAALSAGLELSIDYALQRQDAEAGHEAAAGAEHAFQLTGPATAIATTLPVAVFVLATWLLMIRRSNDTVLNLVFPIGAAIILGLTVTAAPIQFTALVMAALVAILVVRRCSD